MAVLLPRDFTGANKKEKKRSGRIVEEGGGWELLSFCVCVCVYTPHALIGGAGRMSYSPTNQFIVDLPTGVALIRVWERTRMSVGGLYAEPISKNQW